MVDSEQRGSEVMRLNALSGESATSSCGANFPICEEGRLLLTGSDFI